MRWGVRRLGERRCGGFTPRAIALLSALLMSAGIGSHASAHASRPDPLHAAPSGAFAPAHPADRARPANPPSPTDPDSLLPATRIVPAPDLPAFLADSVHYLWPTDASRYLSGTFAETRSAHLHTGIDIKTWGREGYKVFATRDGVLHRIQTGPGGYGNALYLRHDDGSYSVYAHLRNFIPSIEQVADSLRLPRFRHSLDAVVDTLGLRFAQGDVIAFTGSTGVGPPHLHFEIRSAEQVPYNPLYARFPIQDTRDPRITMILAESLTRSAEGGLSFDRVAERRALRPQGRSADGTVDFGTVRMAGPLALSVDASDRADDVANVYAVYRLSMHVNDTLRFASQASTLPFEFASHMFVDRHYEWLRSRRAGLQRLHVRPVNQLPIYRTGPESGVLDGPPGTYRIRIEAEDHAGNRQAATLTWVREPDPKQDSAALWTMAGGDAGDSGGAEGAARAQPQGLGSLWTEARFDTVITTEARVRLATGDERFWVDIPQGAALETRSLRIVAQPFMTDSEPDAIRFLVEGEPIPFVEPIQVVLHLPEAFADRTPSGRPGLRTLRRNPETGEIEAGRGMWTVRSGGTLGFRTRELRSFEVYLDTTRPSLSDPVAAWGENRSRTLGVRAGDPQAPLDAASAMFVVDGIRGIPIYDPDRSMFLFHRPGVNPARARCVAFSVADMTGQRAEQHWSRAPDGRFEPASDGVCETESLRSPLSR